MDTIFSFSLYVGIITKASDINTFLCSKKTNIRYLITNFALILPNTFILKAIERTYNTDYWITILIVVICIAVFLLKVIDTNKLKGYAFSFFSKNFIKEELEEDTSFFNPFHIIFSIFTGLILSLLLYKLLIYKSININRGFYTYAIVFLSIAVFFICKWFLEAALVALFEIRESVRFFLVSKFSYLYAISFLLFFAIILTEYAQLSFRLVLYFSAFLFLFRFVFHLFSNKKLIFSKLFYFILYFCALEIAPLLILFKLMF